MIKCPDCDKDVSADSCHCPFCGTGLLRHMGKSCWMAVAHDWRWILGVALILAAILIWSLGLTLLSVASWCALVVLYAIQLRIYGTGSVIEGALVVLVLAALGLIVRREFFIR